MKSRRGEILHRTPSEMKNATVDGLLDALHLARSALKVFRVSIRRAKDLGKLARHEGGR